MKLSSRDVIGGGLILAVGVMFLFEIRDLRLGTASRMGPGYFPLIAAGVVCLLALAVILTAGPERFRMPVHDARPLFWVVVSTAAFALTLRSFGVVPAIFLTTVIAAFADRSSRPLPALLLGLGTAAFAWGVFIVALEMPLRAFRVPF